MHIFSAQKKSGSRQRSAPGFSCGGCDFQPRFHCQGWQVFGFHGAGHFPGRFDVCGVLLAANDQCGTGDFSSAPPNSSSDMVLHRLMIFSFEKPIFAKAPCGMIRKSRFCSLSKGLGILYCFCQVEAEPVPIPQSFYRFFPTARSLSQAMHIDFRHTFPCFTRFFDRHCYRISVVNMTAGAGHGFPRAVFQEGEYRFQAKYTGSILRMRVI